MAGSYPQYSDPQLRQSNYSEPQPTYPHPSALPPPVPYPSGRRWRLAAAILIVLAVVAGATTAIVYAVNAQSSSRSGGALTETSAKAAIQNYLDAMLKGNTDTVARNTACGFYDAVKERRSDQALARLASETFRKQFSKAQVTSIDKMVFLSEHQAQVLFTMRVAPVVRASRERDEQAIAQLLSQGNQLYVCQYLLRSAGSY